MEIVIHADATRLDARFLGVQRDKVNGGGSARRTVVSFVISEVKSLGFAVSREGKHERTEETELLSVRVEVPHCDDLNECRRMGAETLRERLAALAESL